MANCWIRDLELKKAAMIAVKDCMKLQEKETLLVVTDTEQDMEGDIVAWHLNSLNKNGREDGRFELIVFND